MRGFLSIIINLAISAIAFADSDPLTVGDFIITKGEDRFYAIPASQLVNSDEATTVIPILSKNIYKNHDQEIIESEAIILFIYNGRPYKWFVNHKTVSDIRSSNGPVQ